MTTFFFFGIVRACKFDQTIIQRLSHRGCNFKSGVASYVRADTRLVTLQLGYYCIHKNPSVHQRFSRTNDAPFLATNGASRCGSVFCTCTRRSRTPHPPPNQNSGLSFTRRRVAPALHHCQSGKESQAVKRPPPLKLQSFAQR